MVALELSASSTDAENALARHKTVYITRSGKLAGWLDRRAFADDPVIENAYTEVAPGYGANEGDDVRQALAKMLGQGVAELPVVSRSGELVGLLNLPSILAVTSEGAAEGTTGEVAAA